MSTLEKKLLAIANGKELPWKQTVKILEAYGVITTFDAYHSTNISITYRCVG